MKNASAETSGKSRKTLWIVSELYYPEETSTGYYLTKLAEGLAGDFEVKALCGQPNYSARGTNSPKRETHNNVDIFRAWGTRLDKNVIPFRIINMLSLGFSIFVKALFHFKKGEKVLVVTTPPVLPFITAIACVLKGAEYVLLIHDNYPEILIAVGKTTENSLLVKILNSFNRQLYKYAAKIIVVGRDMREMILSKTNGLNIPVDYIPNWAELERVSPADRADNALLKELGLEKKFVFLYAGNMGHPNDLESIVECAEKLENDSDFHFIFLGAGVKRKWLENEVRSKNLTNITVLNPRPRSEQNVFLNACDVAIVSLVKKMKGVSMPSRTYNILAVGKPILALTEPESEAAKVVAEDKVGWIVSPNAPDALYETLRQIKAESGRIPEMQINSRAAALKKYSLQKAVEEYRKSLIDL